MNFNIKNEEELYTEIGQLLIDSLPEDFQKAWIRVLMIDDVWSLSIYYLKENGRYGYFVNDSRELDDSFIKLRQAFKDAGQEPWTMATFALTNAGGMALDLGYEEPEFGYAPEQEEAWIQKYLGDDPQIDLE
jgi:Protein of unknown function, DUF600.